MVNWIQQEASREALFAGASAFIFIYENKKRVIHILIVVFISIHLTFSVSWNTLVAQSVQQTYGN